MSLRVLVASSTAKLMSLADVKLRLGITDSSQDTVLGQIIDDASSAIATYLGRDLARQRYLETVAGTGRVRLLLSRYPLDRDSITLTIDDLADTDWSVEDAETGRLWRDSGWPAGIWAIGEEPERSTAVTYKAGYVLPDQIVAWSTLLVVVAGSWVRPTVTATAPPLLMECTTAGTMAAGEPTWPIVAGGTVTSGTAVFTARDAKELPHHLRDIAWLLVYAKYRDLFRAPGVASLSGDGFSASFFATHTETAMPPNVESALESWRF